MPSVTAPPPIAELIAEVEAIGGSVRPSGPRRWDFTIYCRYDSGTVLPVGTVRPVHVGHTSYTNRGGQPNCSGVRMVSETIAMVQKCCTVVPGPETRAA